MFKLLISIFIICASSVLYAQSDIENAVKLLNDVRQQNELYPLEVDDRLNEIANIRAKELSVNFSHIRPNNTKYDELLYQNKIRVLSSDENIAYRFKNAETVISYWMNSEQYKVNILSNKFTHVGIAYYEINGEDYWVAVFIQLIK